LSHLQKSISISSKFILAIISLLSFICCSNFLFLILLIKFAIDLLDIESILKSVYNLFHIFFQTINEEQFLCVIEIDVNTLLLEYAAEIVR